MKKIFAVIIVVCMCVGLCACGGSKKSKSCGHPNCEEYGPFWCMGKNDTCPNKTYCCYDFYCDECD